MMEDVPDWHRKRAAIALGHVEEMGIGSSTTCGYQFVSDDDEDDDVEIMHFFVYTVLEFVTKPEITGFIFFLHMHLHIIHWWHYSLKKLGLLW